MTVTSTSVVSGPHIADGVNRDWPFTFKVTNVAHMALRITDADGSNAEVILSGFTIDDAYLDNNAGGNVRYPVAPTAPLLSGKRVFPYRVVPYVQETQIGNQGGFFPRTHERAFDNLEMQIQQLNYASVPPGGGEGQVLGKASASDNDVQWQNAGAGDMLSVQYGVTPQQYGGVLGANLADAIDTGKAVILPSDPTTWTAEVADAMMVFQHIDQVRANSPSVINFPAGTFSPSAGNLTAISDANHNLVLKGAPRITTTMSALVSVTPDPPPPSPADPRLASATMVIDVVDAGAAEVNNYVLMNAVRPNRTLSGDRAARRQRCDPNELGTAVVQLGTATVSGTTIVFTGGKFKDDGVTPIVCSDVLAVGDLITCRNETRVVAGGGINDGTNTVTVSVPYSFTSSVTRDITITRAQAGTISTAGSSVNVTGVGTSFTTTANKGDILVTSGMGIQIVDIPSDTSLVLSHAVTIPASSKYGYATMAELLSGAHKITAKSGNRLTLRSRNRMALLPLVGVVTADIKIIRTVFSQALAAASASVGQGMIVRRGGCIELQDIVLEGTGTDPSSYGIAVTGYGTDGLTQDLPTQRGGPGAVILGDGCAVVDFGRTVYCGGGGVLQSFYSYFCGSWGNGVWVAEGGIAWLRGAVATGNRSKGFVGSSGSVMLLTACVSAGNGSDGIDHLEGATIYAELPFVWGNGGVGLRGTGNGGCHVSEGVIGANGGPAISFDSWCSITANRLYMFASQGSASVSLKKSFATLNEAWITGGFNGGASHRGVDAFLSTVDITEAGITGHNQYGVCSDDMSRVLADYAGITGNTSADVKIRGAGGVLADTAYIGTISIDDDGGTFRGKSLLNTPTLNGAVTVWNAPSANGSTAWNGAATTSIQAPRRNYIRNPSFDVWQAGTSFTAATYNADLWKSVSTAARTFSRQAGFSGARYCMRAARDAGNATATGIILACNLAPELAYQLAGKTITISADVRCGANFSATSNNLQLQIGYGTGVGETFSPASSASFFPTGNGSLTAESKALSTTEARITWSARTIPSSATEIGIRFLATPSGTAGAADYYEITNIKLEIGDQATAFEFEPMATTRETAMRYYQKSFLEATTPAQNVGTGTGEFHATATIAAANPNRLGTVQFMTPMIAAPSTVTLYNPAAANAQVRDLTAAADCSASATSNLSDRGFVITCTGNAGTTLGGDLGVHWVADARTF